MENPPLCIDDARVIAFAFIAAPVVTRGNTLHLVNGIEIGSFAALAICQYDNEEDAYLFYCNDSWKVVTDTCHDSVDAAKVQAAFEFDGINSCWQGFNMI